MHDLTTPQGRAEVRKMCDAAHCASGMFESIRVRANAYDPGHMSPDTAVATEAEVTRAIRLASAFSTRASAIAALLDAQDAEIAALKAERDRLREALAPFAALPIYVYDGDGDRRWVPTPQPREWIGGGWFSTAEARKVRAALCGTK